MEPVHAINQLPLHRVTGSQVGDSRPVWTNQRRVEHLARLLRGDVTAAEGLTPASRCGTGAALR